MAARPIVAAIASLFGIEVAKENSDELALNLEQLLGNTGSSLSDYINKDGVLQLEKLISDNPEAADIVKDTLNFSQDQIVSAITKPLPQDYLSQSDFGQTLANSGLEILGYDISGNPIVSPTQIGAGDYINKGDIVELDLKTGAIFVADKNGSIINVLNADGTKNEYLTGLSKGNSISGYKPYTGMDMSDPTDLPPNILGFPVVTDKNNKPVIYVPPAVDIPNHTGHGDSGKVEVDPIVGGGFQPSDPITKDDVYITSDSHGKPINLPSYGKLEVDIDHILDRHTVGGKTSQISGKKDNFPDNWTDRQIENSIKEAYNGAKLYKTVEQNGEIKQILHGYSKGIKIEMWLNKSTNKIETAYPKKN